MFQSGLDHGAPPVLEDSQRGVVMKSSQRRKLEKACDYLREVVDDLETEGSEEFDALGVRLDDLAGEIEDLLADDETRARDEDAGDD